MHRQDAKKIELPYIEYFRSHIYSNCKEAIEEFGMIKAGDKVAVEITWDCNTLTMCSVFLEYQRERNYDFEVEFFVETKEGKLDEKVEKVLNYNGITKYHQVEARHTEELYESIKAAGCNIIALHQNYNHVVKANLRRFMRRKKQIVFPPVSELADHGLVMIRPMYMVKDAYILHWINKVGVDARLGDEVTLFGGASLAEEGIDETGLHSAAEYQFNVYERV